MQVLSRISESYRARAQELRRRCGEKPQYADGTSRHWIEVLLDDDRVRCADYIGVPITFYLTRYLSSNPDRHRVALT